MTEDCKTCIILEEHKSVSMSSPTSRVPQLELLERQLQAERAQQCHLQTLADQQSNPTRPHHVIFHGFPAAGAARAAARGRAKAAAIVLLSTFGYDSDLQLSPGSWSCWSGSSRRSARSGSATCRRWRTGRGTLRRWRRPPRCRPAASTTAASTTAASRPARCDPEVCSRLLPMGKSSRGDGDLGGLDDGGLTPRSVRRRWSLHCWDVHD